VKGDANRPKVEPLGMYKLSNTQTIGKVTNKLKKTFILFF